MFLEVILNYMTLPAGGLIKPHLKKGLPPPSFHRALRRSSLQINCVSLQVLRTFAGCCSGFRQRDFRQK